MGRRNLQNLPLVIDGTGATALSTNDAGFDVVGGPRFVAGILFNPVSAFHFTYFGIHTWNASASVTGDNDLALPGDLGLATLDFFDADTMRVQYSGDLDSYEFSYFHLWRPAFSMFAGFRYIQLKERFDIRSTDLDSGTSDYRVQAINQLYGGQIGGRYKWVRGSWLFETTIKTGFFGNAADQTQFVGDFDNTIVIRNSHGGESKFAALNELNFSVALQLSKNMAFRGGYNLIWLHDVALATSQLDFTDTPTSGTGISNGDVLLHGVNFGFEIHW